MSPRVGDSAQRNYPHLGIPGEPRGLHLIEPLLRYSFLKLSAFRRNHRFRQYDVIIYDVRADFGTLFATRNRLVMSYPCAKFQRDMIIHNEVNCICFMYFWTTEIGLSIMTSLI